ncbi:hypothetical protein ACOSP7_006306 [Xanthoceras sorbifolium]
MTCNGNGEVASGKVACGEVVSGYVVTNYVAWPNTGIRVGMDQVMKMLSAKHRSKCGSKSPMVKASLENNGESGEAGVGTDVGIEGKCKELDF